MKKIYVLFLMMLLSSSVFAKVAVKLETAAFGYEFNLDFPDGGDPCIVDTGLILSGVNFSGEYIFKPVNNISFYTGGTLGAYKDSFMFGVIGGMYYPLFKGNLCSGELNTELDFDFACNTGFLLNPKINFVLMNQNSKGWFFESGLSFVWVGCGGYSYTAYEDDGAGGTEVLITGKQHIFATTVNLGIGYRF